MTQRFGVKERVKIALKRAAASREGVGEPRILTYHSVGERDHPMNVTVDAFREQIAWLSDHRPVITVEEAMEGRDGVAITFDDGYRDNLENAQPILAARNAPWTLFFVAGRAGGRLDHDGGAAHAELLSWDEVRALHAAGVAIGGHTLTHVRLSGLSPDDQRREIQGSYNAIASEIGHPPRGFAYPYGSALDYTAETARYVAEAGYAYAVSNRYGPVSRDSVPWTARRVWVDRTDTLAFFQQKVEGRLDRLSVLDSWAGIRARRLVNALR